MSKNMIHDLKDKPSVLAEKYKTPKITVLNVLVGACSLLANELSATPQLRRELWQRYFDNVTISTKPTKKGEREVDVFNPSYRVKRLDEVPFSKFDDDLWYELLTAQKRDFINVYFNDEDFQENILKELSRFYSVSDSPEEVGKEWQLFHDEVLNWVIKNELFPLFKKQMAEAIKKKSEKFVLESAGQNLTEVLMTPPYVTKDGKTPWVVSFICHQSESKGKRMNKAITATAVSEVGDLMDVRTFEYLLIPFASEKYPDKHKEEMESLKDMIIQSKADLLVVGANLLIANRFRTQLRELASEILESENFEPWVAFGSCDVPHVFSTSMKAKTNLKGFS